MNLSRSKTNLVGGPMLKSKHPHSESADGSEVLYERTGINCKAELEKQSKTPTVQQGFFTA